MLTITLKRIKFVGYVKFSLTFYYFTYVLFISDD